MNEQFPDEVLERVYQAAAIAASEAHAEFATPENTTARAIAAMRAVLEGHLGPALVAVTARCQSCGAYCDDIQFEYAGASDGLRHDSIKPTSGKLLSAKKVTKASDRDE